MKTFPFVAILILLGTAMVSVINSSLSLPVVTVDAVTGECMHIDSPDGELPCSGMPERYIRQSAPRAEIDAYRAPENRVVAQVHP